MSARFDAPLIAGSVVFGDQGLGVLGSVIRANTATGTHGPGLLYNDWDAGDDAKEFRALIVTPPASGTLFVNEDGSYTLAGAADGTHTLTYRLFVDGQDLGTTTATFNVGAALAERVATLAATEAQDIAAMSANSTPFAERVAALAAVEGADSLVAAIQTAVLLERIASLAAVEGSDTARARVVTVDASDTFVPVIVANGVESVLRAALEPQGIKVYRRRARALNQSDRQAAIVGIAATRGDRYGSDGSTDWRVTIRLIAIGRALYADDAATADQLAGRTMLAAHDALAAEPTLGIPGLDWDNGFSLAEDDEDLDEDITALVALYEYQICTQGTSAAIAA